MKIRSLFLAAMSVLALCSIGPRGARAAEVLYDGVGFLQGTQSFVKTFNLTSPGTLTVTLTNVAWPQQLSSLNLLMTTASGSVGPEMGAGISTFSTKAGEIYAQCFGTAQGSLNTGVYGLEILFTPSGGGGATVPLPTSIVLLLSGIGLMLWHRRIRTEAPDAYSNSADIQAI